MSDLKPCLYLGAVSHRRFASVKHELVYRAVSVFLDIDQLEQINKTSWIMGYNRRRLLSVRDADHGPGDGTPINIHVRGLLEANGLQHAGRIFMLCYPRILGRLFNPITIYMAIDSEDQPAAMIYEVNNTWGGRHSYVVPVAGFTGHEAEKALHVSPFNQVEGTYRFLLRQLADKLQFDIAYFVEGGLKLTARIEGERASLNDWQLLRLCLQLAIQPLKIWGGIHWEALKLYAKGLRVGGRTARVSPPDEPRRVARAKLKPPITQP
ncbi:DUF1365 domain-containing protein [Aestuariivirga litoralis]|uniref:DUF1365 domain-containing protein n=1 Tax=Aestuariivirga litoralis TaxID=2650924 RepID=UPI0018C7276C|nr:DUF1365 domain-containing protein [Aestuariivirga litoralis]